MFQGSLFLHDGSGPPPVVETREGPLGTPRPDRLQSISEPPDPLYDLVE